MARRSPARTLIRASVWAWAAALGLSLMRWFLRGDLGMPEAVPSVAALCLATAVVDGLILGPRLGLIVGIAAALASDLAATNALTGEWLGLWSRELQMWSYVGLLALTSGGAGAAGGLIGGVLASALARFGGRTLPVRAALAWTALVVGAGWVKWLNTVHNMTDYSRSYALGRLQQGFWDKATADAWVAQAETQEMIFLAVVAGLWLGGLLAGCVLCRLDNRWRKAALVVSSAGLIVLGVLLPR